MRTQTMKLLPVQLTEREVRERGEEVARKCVEVNRAKATQKEEAKARKDDLEVMEGEREHLATIVRSGKELREVECEERVLPHKRVVQVCRIDTDEVVHSRAMTPEEIEQHQQPSLFPLAESRSP